MKAVSQRQIRQAWLGGSEIALFDVRSEHAFAQGHPLFAAQLPLDRIAVEAALRIPRLDVPVVLYDDGEGLTNDAKLIFKSLGYRNVELLEGDLASWRQAGFELFADVNSYSKAFGELVEHRRHTPSLSAERVQSLIDVGADIAILDARRFDEYATMSIPRGVSVPGAELVLRARTVAPNPETTIIVNCAGRTRSIIGAQSLINAGLPNPIYALRNGTIGWTLAGQEVEKGAQRRAPDPQENTIEARSRAREIAYRAGVKHINFTELEAFNRDATRTLYRFDVRLPEAYVEGHLPDFRNAPGGQLVQETDHYAPVRSARIVLADDLGVRADMSASWLAQMGWDVYVLDASWPLALDAGFGQEPPPRDSQGRYKRPYEGTDNKAAAMQAYLDWEYGLVEQLRRDGTHGFVVI